MRVRCARERPCVERGRATVQRVLSAIYFRNRSSPPSPLNMPAVQFVVEGGKALNGSIRPSGNKNAALPIVAAALLPPNVFLPKTEEQTSDLQSRSDLGFCII